MLQSRANREDSNDLDAEKHERDGTHSPAKSNIGDKPVEHYPVTSASASLEGGICASGAIRFAA